MTMMKRAMALMALSLWTRTTELQRTRSSSIRVAYDASRFKSSAYKGMIEERQDHGAHWTCLTDVRNISSVSTCVLEAQGD